MGEQELRDLPCFSAEWKVCSHLPHCHRVDAVCAPTLSAEGRWVTACITLLLWSFPAVCITFLCFSLQLCIESKSGFWVRWDRDCPAAAHSWAQQPGWRYPRENLGQKGQNAGEIIVRETALQATRSKKEWKQVLEQRLPCSPRRGPLWNRYPHQNRFIL